MKNDDENTQAGSDCQERLVSGSFTPGPWVCDPPIKGHDHINVWEKSGIGHIAAVSTGLTPDPSAVSNARLISAAPDMLEALLNLENDDGTIPAHAWNLCQAAISKAISSANNIGIHRK